MLINNTTGVWKGLIQDQSVRVASPSLWSIESPAMYTLVSKLLVNGKEFDDLSVLCGKKGLTTKVHKGFTEAHKV